MQNQYNELVCLYDGVAHYVLFTLQSVMATDIADNNLTAFRKARWDKAFKNGEAQSGCEDEGQVNSQATVIIEHLMQASDVSHTMQQWRIFHMWNENLFLEMYTAFKAGRSEEDPAEFW